MMENKDENKQLYDNEGLVIYIYNKYVKNTFLVPLDQVDDVLQQGRIGLLYAIRSYKSDAGVKFSTYACKLIRREMFKFINHDMQSGGETVSLDNKVRLPSGDKATFHDCIPSDVDIERTYIDEETASEEHDFLLSILEAVPEKYKALLTLWLEGYTYEQIAKQFGVTKQCISERMQSLLKKLKRLAKLPIRKLNSSQMYYATDCFSSLKRKDI